ncbi:MAG: heme biosynthesis protein HemY [Comamonadaceae bacterium CG1_02_60_18]|nr:MAG: heme biosynthesis protein HemY [Comamonadaceae bacterium CG1_02_60_18]PIQ55494.1 MAG: heme biosynthesis protein HemY [Comamonadaceae bacterium CG12_big_fil_rev_8_21_14_0_65_59_15]
MRVALWFLGLFGVAVALALFASGNESTVTFFWPPHRVDVALNFFVLLLGLLFALLYLALRALSALFAMPGHARQWRLRNQERVMTAALLDALSHLMAGRFIRARKAAELVISREAALTRAGEAWSEAARLRVLAHLLAAESAQALQDRGAREMHFGQALEQSALRDAAGTRDGVQLRAVRWSLEDRDADRALQWLGDLPAGVARRTLALRLRLKVARMAGRNDLALETARLLVKHHAFSGLAATSLVRALALEWVLSSQDPEQLLSIWLRLDASEQALPEVALTAAGRLLRLDGDVTQALAWLLPVWERMTSARGTGLSSDQKVFLMRVMENAFAIAGEAIDSAWLARIEAAQLADPGDVALQYLAGVACLHLQLWGKAQHLMRQVLPRLHDVGLQTRAWQALAELAQCQGDDAQAAVAWKNAAQVTLRRRV